MGNKERKDITLTLKGSVREGSTKAGDTMYFLDGPDGTVLAQTKSREIAQELRALMSDGHEWVKLNVTQDVWNNKLWVWINKVLEEDGQSATESQPLSSTSPTAASAVPKEVWEGKDIHIVRESSWKTAAKLGPEVVQALTDELDLPNLRARYLYVAHMIATDIARDTHIDKGEIPFS
jgi:hypothetical protein